MAGRYDSNPFDEDEVNPFSVSVGPPTPFRGCMGLLFVCPHLVRVCERRGFRDLVMFELQLREQFFVKIGQSGRKIQASQL